MTTKTHALARAGLAVGVALVTAALTATTAGATSDELQYTCDYWFADSEGSGSATASFDSAIDDGLVVEVGESVSLDPLTGTITLPVEFMDVVRDNDLSSIEGEGSTYMGFEEPGYKIGEVFFRFGETSVPAEGTLTLQIEGEVGEYEPQQAGPHTLVAGPYMYVYLKLSEVDGGPEAGISCELVAEGDPAIDAFSATEAATPTTTVTTTTATAVRPLVVQTDFAADDPSSTVALLAGGGLALTAALMLGHHVRGYSSRRH